MHNAIVLSNEYITLSKDMARSLPLETSQKVYIGVGYLKLFPDIIETTSGRGKNDHKPDVALPN